MLIGLGAVGYMVASSDVGEIVSAIISLGFGGFSLYLLIQTVLVLPLGAAWWILVKDAQGAKGGKGFCGFLWARLIRNSATNVLPFSTIGGLAAGGKIINNRGVAWPVVSACTMVDVTAEFIGELIFMAYGIFELSRLVPSSRWVTPMVVSLGVAALCGLIFIFLQLQTKSTYKFLTAKILNNWAKKGNVHVERLHAEILKIYRNKTRILVSLTLHTVAWFSSSFALWVALYMMGRPVPLAEAFAIEALVQALLSLAFAIPGAVGVQEGAYITFCLIFGIPPGVALALSFIRRGRDLLVGVPTLLIWQSEEVRLAGRKARQKAAGKRAACSGVSGKLSAERETQENEKA